MTLKVRAKVSPDFFLSQSEGRIDAYLLYFSAKCNHTISIKFIISVLVLTSGILVDYNSLCLSVFYMNRLNTGISIMIGGKL